MLHPRNALQEFLHLCRHPTACSRPIAGNLWICSVLISQLLHRFQFSLWNMFSAKQSECFTDEAEQVHLHPSKDTLQSGQSANKSHHTHLQLQVILFFKGWYNLPQSLTGAAVPIGSCNERIWVCQSCDGKSLIHIAPEQARHGISLPFICKPGGRWRFLQAGASSNSGSARLFCLQCTLNLKTELQPLTNILSMFGEINSDFTAVHVAP